MNGFIACACAMASYRAASQQAEYREYKARMFEVERIRAMPRYDGVTKIPVVVRRKS